MAEWSTQQSQKLSFGVPVRIWVRVHINNIEGGRYVQKLNKELSLQQRKLKTYRPAAWSLCKYYLLYWGMLCNWLTRLSLKQKFWVRVPVPQHYWAIIQWLNMLPLQGSLPSSNPGSPTNTIRSLCNSLTRIVT